MPLVYVQLYGKDHILVLIWQCWMLYHIQFIKRKGMLPNQFPIFPPFPPHIYQNHHFPLPFCTLPFPYYFPFPIEHTTDAYRLLQPKQQRNQQQYQSKQLEKDAITIIQPYRQGMKKKSAKHQRRVQQIQTADKNQLKKNSTISEQKEGRNANSNLLRMFFRRLQFTLQNNPEKITKIWKKFNFNITVEDFTHWIKEAKIDYRNYIRVPSVKKLFRMGSKIRQHSKALRVMLKMFIDEESLCCYLTSRKIKRDAMPYNLLSIRSIYKELFDDEQ